jgi:hypothetical protein
MLDLSSKSENTTLNAANESVSESAEGYHERKDVPFISANSVH